MRKDEEDEEEDEKKSKGVKPRNNTRRWRE